VGAAAALGLGTGNLFATLLIQPLCPIERSPQLGFAIGLSTADLLGAYVAAADVKLKWPNDVLVKGKKIAGILIEACQQRHARHWRWR